MISWKRKAVRRVPGSGEYKEWHVFKMEIHAMEDFVQQQQDLFAQPLHFQIPNFLFSSPMSFGFQNNEYVHLGMF